MSGPLDEARLELLSGGDPAIRAELLSLLLDEARGLVGRIDDAVDDGDLVRETAHALKGIAGNVGAPRLAGAAGRLEDAARAGDLATCRAARDAVRHALRELADLSLSARSR